MFRKIKHYLYVFVVSFLLLCQFSVLYGSQSVTGLIGEDLQEPSGMILAVNEFNSKLYSGGFRGTEKREEIFINLTLVNSGSRSFEVDPNEDFILLKQTEYHPVEKSSLTPLNKVSFFPGMQTRFNLCFVAEAESQVQPVFIFKVNDCSLKVICDNEAGKALKGKSSGMTVKDAVHTGELLINAGRGDDARTILMIARVKEPDNPFILLLLAITEDTVGDPEMSLSYLRAINPYSVKTPEDAAEFGRIANSYYFYRTGIDVLEVFYKKNLLNSSQKLVLAKAYYYDERYPESEHILLPVISSGTADKEAHFLMGNILDRKNDLNRAIMQWEMALDIDPEYVQALYNIGIAYYKKGDVEQAREYWKKVLKLDPDPDTRRAAEEAILATDF